MNFAIYNGSGRAVFEIDNVQLMDDQGNNLIKNGGFSKGSHFWFFSTDNHLPWHIKNMLLHFFFEQGLLSAILGFQVVGLTDSPIDAPRVAFLYFPGETLEWFFPQAEQSWGKIVRIDFKRQEPKKHHLSDAGLALDLPILFHFENQQLLLWLVEFQEDKSKFSIYKLLRYTTDMMEAYQDALVVPTVLFTDRKKWRKSVPLELHTQVNDRLFLHFEYVFHKLFDLNARDYYNMDNPVVKILLPKMNYRKEERIEVISQAYKGLFQLVTRGLFDKYVDFIDVYSEISDQEQKQLYENIIQHKETAMLAQYIKEKGRQEGMQKGMQKGSYNTMVYMVRNAEKKGLSEEMIAQIANIDIDLVRKILRNEPVDIPLHLLADSEQWVIGVRPQLI